MKWKIWLRPNLYADNEFVASINTSGKKVLRNADIARLIKDTGSGSELEYDIDILLQIIEQYDRVICEQVQRGQSVLTGFCQLTPKVIGNWSGLKDKFNPEEHKIVLDLVSSAGIRAMLKEVSVEVLGVKDGGSFIGLVTDTATGITDGTVTAGDDILIEGDKIKIDPLGEEGLGVYLVNVDGKATLVTRRLTQNEPQKIIARIPADLPPGQYTLRVQTKYTTASILLREPRIIEYDKLLVVP